MSDLKKLEQRIHQLKIKLWGLRVDLYLEKEKIGEGVETTPF